MLLDSQSSRQKCREAIQRGERTYLREEPAKKVSLQQQTVTGRSKHSDGAIHITIWHKRVHTDKVLQFTGTSTTISSSISPQFNSNSTPLECYRIFTPRTGYLFLTETSSYGT